jgi:hypothetical protein
MKKVAGSVLGADVLAGTTSDTTLSANQVQLCFSPSTSSKRQSQLKQ